MENEILQQILTELKDLKQGQMGTDRRLDKMEADISAIKGDVADIKENSEEVRTSTNVLINWAENVELVTHVKLFPNAK